MSIDNVFASVAVKDVEAAASWYARLIGSAPSTPLPEVAEWRFACGGGLQVYQLAERAGHGSLTFAVRDIEEHVQQLSAMGVDVSQRFSNSGVDTLMVVDPDGNHIAFCGGA